MMNSVFLVFVCFTVLSVNCAVVHKDQVEIPGHEGQCYNNDATTFYRKGEIMNENDSTCSQMKCLGILSETGKLRVETLTCPAVEAGAGCTIVQDLSKPYPDCCPKIVPLLSNSSNHCVSHIRDE